MHVCGCVRLSIRGNGISAELYGLEQIAIDDYELLTETRIEVY